MCLPSFDVLNCWLNLVASCLDDENEIPLKVIASFSASRFALPSIPLIVLHRLVIFVQGLNKISPFLPCVCVDAVLAVIVHSWQFRRGGISFTEPISSCHHIQYLCWYRFLVETVSSSRDVMCAMSRTVRNIFSSLWQSVGSERLLRAVSTSCLYLSQSAFFRLT